MNSNKPKNLVYMNTFAEDIIHKKSVKKFVDNKIGKKWKSMGYVMIPNDLEEDMINEDFFNGVSAQQFFDINTSGGTFINPMLTGYQSNFNMWNNILHRDNTFEQSISYVDVPYEVYALNNDTAVDEYDYNENSKKLKQLVSDIKISLYNDNIDYLQ